MTCSLGVVGKLSPHRPGPRPLSSCGRRGPPSFAFACYERSAARGGLVIVCAAASARRCPGPTGTGPWRKLRLSDLLDLLREAQLIGFQTRDLVVFVPITLGLADRLASESKTREEKGSGGG